MSGPSNSQEDRGRGLLALYTVLWALSVIAAALRVVARKVAHLKLWRDDWLLLAATVGIAVPVGQEVRIRTKLRNKGRYRCTVCSTLRR